MSRWLAAFVVSAASAVAFPSVACADVIAPGARACDDKPVGATCDLPLGGAKGVCANTTCSKLDYSQGTPPTTKTYPCVRCQPAPPKPAAPKDAGVAPKDAGAAPSSAPSSAPSAVPSSAPSPSASAEPSAAPEPSASQAPSAPAPTPSAAPTPAPAPAPAEPVKKQGACHAAAGAADATGFALIGLSALAAVLRRRRARD